MMKHLCILFFFFAVMNADAQENYAGTADADDIGYWLGLGIGANYFGPTFHASISVSRCDNIFTLRYLKAEEFRFNPGGGDYDSPALSMKEIGILYGRSLRKKYLTFSLSAGISTVSGTNRGKHIIYKQYEPQSMATFGVPFEAEFKIELSNSLAIGGAFFGDLNTKKSFTGGMAKISIGKFL